MSELIGVTYTPVFLKQHLLMFDRIACASGLCKLFTARPAGADLRWLMDRGVVFEPELGPVYRQELEIELQQVRNVSEADVRTAFASAGGGPLGFAVPIFNLAAVVFIESTSAMTRALATELRAHKLNAVPITGEWTATPDTAATRIEVVDLVIKDLPIPGENHGFADIFAFRDEARADGLIQGLQVWINEMASGKLSPIEVSDKLEDLLSRYERALKVEKMSRGTGVVETIICSTVEVAESLVKFQWSKIASKLFEVKRKQIDLTKAEMRLPGREVAYIVKARERFQTT